MEGGDLCYGRHGNAIRGHPPGTALTAKTTDGGRERGRGKEGGMVCSRLEEERQRETERERERRVERECGGVKEVWSYC